MSTTTIPRPSLMQACATAGLIPQAPAVKPPTFPRPDLFAVPPEFASGGSPLVRLLLMAYERPCFVCGETGECRHRQPDVEMALLLAGMKGAQA